MIVKVVEAERDNKSKGLGLRGLATCQLIGGPLEFKSDILCFLECTSKQVIDIKYV